MVMRWLTQASLTWHAVRVQQLGRLRNTMPRAMHAIGSGRRGYTEQSNDDGNDDQVHVKIEVLGRWVVGSEERRAVGSGQRAVVEGAGQPATGDRWWAVDRYVVVVDWNRVGEVAANRQVVQTRFERIVAVKETTLGEQALVLEVEERRVPNDCESHEREHAEGPKRPALGRRARLALHLQRHLRWVAAFLPHSVMREAEHRYHDDRKDLSREKDHQTGVYRDLRGWRGREW